MHVSRLYPYGLCSWHTPVLDLEPASTTIVGSSRARCLGHVYRDRSLMVDGCVEGEGDGFTGLDRDGLGVCS